MKDHRDLEVWQKGMELAANVYQLTSGFPEHERYGLSSQMRRAAVSIVSNLAEGAARRTTRDFIAFIHIARGSLAELETQIMLAERIGLPVAPLEWKPRLDELGRMTNALLRSLTAKVNAGTHLK